MYGFPTKSLRSKDSKGMYGLCTSTDDGGDMFTDRQVSRSVLAFIKIPNMQRLKAMSQFLRSNPTNFTKRKSSHV